MVAVLTDAVDPGDYLKKMRKRDSSFAEAFQGGATCPPGRHQRELPRPKPGRYTIAVKVIDIFGNDTMTLVPVTVG